METSPQPRICIVGCGVSGLTTARVLQEAGYAVTIVTDHLPQDTTSAVAAAIWFPYRSGPAEAVIRWSCASHDTFAKLAQDPATGVSMVDFLELLQDEKDAWWLDALPNGCCRPARPDELLAGKPAGFVMHVPMIETQVYLPWLYDQFVAAGGEMTVQTVDDLQDWASRYSIVVNCTGLGAKSLVPDDRMNPISGQLVKVNVLPGIPYVSADTLPGAEPFEATYVFPRRDCIVLGGTAVHANESLDWDVDLGDRLLARCKALVPALKDAVVQSMVVGLRPGRDEIRLERQGAIIHNYGHGGAGFTVSWGCAAAVLELIQRQAGTGDQAT